MKKGLLALAFGGFAIGMTEFNMMGITQEIVQDMKKSIPEVGHLISLYALGVVIGAPILVYLTSKWSSKKTLMMLMFLFFIFNGLFVLSPSFLTMEISRFLSGMPHGAFFGVGAVMASQLVAKEKRAQAIALMFTGMTVANLLGIPLGTFIAQHFSWRLTYGVICFLGLLTALAIYFWLPDLKASQNTSVANQLFYFKKRSAWLIVSIISIGTGGLFAWLSYISPLSTKVSMLPKENMPLVMFLVGLGMFFGNLIGGKLADTISPAKAAIFGFSAMVCCLLVIYNTVSIPWMVYPMSFITGVVSFSIGAPTQLLLLQDAKGAETLASSMGQACFNIGNTLGAFLGGIPISLGFMYQSSMLVGASMAFMGMLLSFTFYKWFVVKK